MSHSKEPRGHNEAAPAGQNGLIWAPIRGAATTDWSTWSSPYFPPHCWLTCELLPGFNTVDNAAMTTHPSWRTRASFPRVNLSSDISGSGDSYFLNLSRWGPTVLGLLNWWSLESSRSLWHRIPMDCKYAGWIEEGGGGRKEQTEQTHKIFTVTESRVLSALATSRLRFFKIRNGGGKKS